jgi:hypothetical protein
MKTPNPDIYRLSDYRYWKVDGIFPPGFIASASFKYNRTTSTTAGYLDNNFMTTATSKDSLLLLYRRSPADDWKITRFNLSGYQTTGNLTVDTLRRGEYAMAIGMPVVFGIHRNDEPAKGGLNIYPNPSGSKFTIEWNAKNASRIKIYNSGGGFVDSIPLKQGQTQTVWKPDNIASGSYVIKLLDKQQKVLGDGRIIYLQ